MFPKIGFQFFSANVFDVVPKGFINLEQFINFIKYSTPKTINVYEKIKQAELNNDKKLKDKLKQNNLFCFSPCVIVSKKRNYNGIILFTGILVLDFDHVENAENLKNVLFNNFKFIICAYISPSRKGVKALVKIPQCFSIEEFKEYFFGLTPFVKDMPGFDGTAKNCVLPLFSSYDPDILYREDFTTFSIKGKDPNPFIPVDLQNIEKVELTNKKSKIVSSIFCRTLSKIIDNGHPQLRSACRVLGGYCASNHIQNYEALQLIEYEVLNHPYFKKGIRNYLKTAKLFFEEGKRMPLYLEESK